ncbi:hypothetical protein [Paenibacillus flagellatus]|uniref:hypothetical protein n=1 Tax=Paenibacillus flagellatus TaxID=2211139 RepID=UPI001FEAF430|nr:hypothetical protein [Paenibacillus flagellatus]
MELIVYTSVEWEVINEIDSLDYMPEPKYEVWHCKQCDRVHVFKGSKHIKTYRVELIDEDNERENHVLDP